ncbi:MAG TPA: hypothetical protein V6C88_20050, partial [Chroococcidiopsis sp.]
TGGGSADLFVLGDETGAFYTGDKANGYALITDFRINQGDRIQLQGSLANYTLGNTSGSLPNGVTISQGDDLIAIVQGINLTTLKNATSSAFVFKS